MDPELVVRFKGDTKDFEDSLKRVKAQLDGLNSPVEKTGSSLSGLAAGFLSVAAAMKAGQVFLDSTKAVQKYENQLKVASGTQQSYAKNTAFLEGLAAKYNKNVIDLGSNFAQLTIATRGTNLEGAKTERLFAAVTATSAALQMSVDDTNGTFRAFIQMVSKGNVQAEELRGQLGERLYGAFNLAAQAMGKSTQELNKMLENGEVLAEDLLPKLTVELERSFGETAQENARNLGSEIEYATGQMTLLIAEMGKSSGATNVFTRLSSDAGDFLAVLRQVNKDKGFLSAVGVGVSELFPDMRITGASERAKSDAQWRMANEGKINKGGNYINAIPGSISSGQAFGLPSSLYSPESTTSPAANEKAKKAAELAARKAEAAINKQVAEWIRESNDRIAEGLLNSQIAQTNAGQTHLSGVDSPGMKGSTGTSNIWQYQGGEINKIGEQFTNAATGDGSATNYDHIIDGMDDAIKRIKEKYKQINSVTYNFGEQLDASIQNAFSGAIVGASEAIGQLAGSLVNGTANLADVGNAFLGIMASLFDSIGKALASYAATILVADIAIGSMNAGGALIGAALAFAAAGVARSQMQDSSKNAFYTGGIVRGQGGVDSVPIWASNGEMILNSGQQNRLWGMISGANSGREFGYAGGGRGKSSEDMNVAIYGRFRGGDIDAAGTAGRKKNNYFSGRKG